MRTTQFDGSVDGDGDHDDNDEDAEEVRKN